MKKKIIGGLIALVAIGLFIAFSGCIEKETSGITPDVPSETVIKTPIDALKMIPNSSRFNEYSDLKALREDKDIANIWESWKNTVVALFGAVGVPEIGIPMDKLNYLVIVTKTRGDDALIIGGDFDLEKIRGYLDDAGFKQDTYRGEEIWYKEKGRYTEIALFKDKLIMGDARRIIQVMKGEEKSLYDNKDVVDVMKKLSAGYFIRISWCEYKDVIASGSSLEKISKEEIKQHEVYKFINKSAAEDFAKNELKEWETKVKDEYVMFSRIVKISEFY